MIRKDVSRRQFLGTLGTVGLISSGVGGMLAGWACKKRTHGLEPNIIVILVDDLGYGETGVYGAKDTRTPNIDSLAQNGIRFTDGYVTCSVCSPTRAGLITGRYQQRFGYEMNPPHCERFSGPEDGLPLSEKTIANWLNPLGYTAGAFGKWHLGCGENFLPLKRGFDYFFGFPSGGHSYLDALSDDVNPILRGTEQVKEITYLTDELSRESTSFIKRHHDHPFFIYLPFFAVHYPLETTEKYLSRFKSIKDKKRRIFAAMMSALDDAVGAILKELRKYNLEEDTLIFFLGDNGGPTWNTTCRNRPLRGFKFGMYEGGIRVPFIMQWKRRLPQGMVYTKPVSSLDICTTAIAAAGGTVQESAKLDGVNLLPYLTGENPGCPHDLLFWRRGPNYAVRMGDWKLISMIGEPVGLFNLAEDISEKINLADRKPEKRKELQTAWDAWNAELIDPLWISRSISRKMMNK